MSVISMKQLLEAGVHFGHQTRRWNPKMAPYIYTERNGIYIIDLQKSVGKVDEAYQAVADIAAEGGSILFVGTKKQAQDAIKVEAERCGMYYVNERWLGGMLTNFKTIKSRIARLKNIERMSEDGTFDVLPKKEVIQLKKEWDKLEKNLGGIKDMKTLPDAIFVVDPKKERICVQEAHTLGIPLIGIADTTAFMVTVEKIMRHGCENVPDYMLSGSRGDFTGVGDIHFFYSADEVLYGALPDFEEACKRANVSYTVSARPKMVHCYCMLPIFKEAKEDFSKIVDILKK